MPTQITSRTIISNKCKIHIQTFSGQISLLLVFSMRKLCRGHVMRVSSVYVHIIVHTLKAQIYYALLWNVVVEHPLFVSDQPYQLIYITVVSFFSHCIHITFMPIH